VVQFQKEFLGAGLFEKPEMRRVMQLLQKSDSGIQFTNNISLYRNKMNFCRSKTVLKKLFCC